MPRTYEERVEELEQKIAQMQNQRKELLAKQKVQDRKNRTHRLIQIGAEMEKAAGREIDPEVLAVYLQTTVKRNDDGTEVTVIDMQKRYYERTEQRLQEQKKETEPRQEDDSSIPEWQRHGGETAQY